MSRCLETRDVATPNLLGQVNFIEIFMLLYLQVKGLYLQSTELCYKPRELAEDWRSLGIYLLISKVRIGRTLKTDAGKDWTLYLWDIMYILAQKVKKMAHTLEQTEVELESRLQETCCHQNDISVKE